MLTQDAGVRWTLVHNEYGEETRRYRVPGGWLYQVRNAAADEELSYMAWHPPVFVPEAK